MRTRRYPLAAIAGVVSAAVFLAAAELVALLAAKEASPLLALGGFVIDIVPQPVKELAIAVFGAMDKVALLAGLGVAVVAAAVLAGVLQLRLPPSGLIVIGAAGAATLATTVTRPGASALAWAPSVVGVVAGGVVLVALIRRLRPASSAPEEGVDRRGFLLIATIAGASALVVGLGSRALNGVTTSITAIRDALRLPSPRSRVTIPDGAELDVPGLSPLFTPNADFYRVDTALTVPTVDPAEWRLVVDGMVGERVELTFDDLLAMGLDEYAVTLTCVSNEVGGGLVGNALWQGVPVRDVLALARPQEGADMVLSTSVDGFTASTPLTSLTDDGIDAILAVAMNGEPLPLEHGFPVRMVVPGLYGYVSATKWVTELTVTTFAQDEAYWTPRGYSAKAPIKMSSRIDTPRSGTPVDAGTVAVAGVAWAQTVGISRVEVSIDDGDWQEAELSAPVNEDTWVQWKLAWEAEAGTHYIAVRATDADGNLQIQERAPIAPDGASGWQRTLVTVRG
ncbi:molybdopterin-dependent oxidoreductase [Microbacterium sp. NPDC055683]